MKQPPSHQKDAVIRTVDGRYIVVRGRLWRGANPNLSPSDEAALVNKLMSARRAVRLALAANDSAAVLAGRTCVERAKQGLGERGPVWWADGAPDLNRKLAKNSVYAEWFERASQS